METKIKNNDKKYNVILLSLLPPPYGGIAQWTKRMLSLAPSYGIDYRFVDESNKSERKHFGDNTSRNIFADIKRAIRIKKDLKKALKETDDSYCVHCCIPSLKFSMLRELSNLKLIKRYKRKYIIHFRSTVSNNVDTKQKRRILKKLLKKSDRIILLNKKSFDFCYEVYPNDKMVILPNFVDESEISKKTNIADEIHNVLYTGMITPEKGIDDIIDVAARFPNITFNLIGRVSEEIKTYFSNHRSDNVHFLGQMDKNKIIPYYENADLFLFLSRFKSEGFSNSLCEAMAKGLPCIVTDWAANKDMVYNGIPETIVEPHNIDSLEKSIKVLKNKSIRTECSSFNYNRVVHEYSDKVIIEKIKGIYKNL